MIPSDEIVRTVLSHIMESAKFDGSAELKRQVAEAVVLTSDIFFTRLAVGSDAASSSYPDGPLPIEALVVTDSGDVYGELLIWVKNGRLEGLEFPWWSEANPTELPQVNRILIGSSGAAT